MSTRIGVVVFPGTNCEHDVVTAVEQLGGRAELVWHGAGDLAGIDAVVLPGGFAHGDYLRPGALARFSPVMTAVARFAADGGPVVGICNGWQVLTEAGLLPGALQKNDGLRFLCLPVTVTVASAASVLTAGVPVGTALRVPINHFSGSYVLPPRDAGPPAGRGPGRVALRREPERVGRRHRRHPQRGGQRRRPDAPPGAGHQRPAGLERRQRAPGVPVDLDGRPGDRPLNGRSGPEGRPAQLRVRAIPARWSTAALTPAVRHVP